MIPVAYYPNDPIHLQLGTVKYNGVLTLSNAPIMVQYSLVHKFPITIDNSMILQFNKLPYFNYLEYVPVITDTNRLIENELQPTSLINNIIATNVLK